MAAAAAVIAAAASAVVALSSPGSPRPPGAALALHPTTSAAASAHRASPAALKKSDSSSPAASARSSPAPSGPASPATSASTSPANSPAPAQPATGYAQAVLADHPTAYWQFTDATGSAGYADSSGDGNTLPAGMTTLTGSGVRNLPSAISTAGGGTYTTSPLSPLMGDASRTVEAWFKTTSPGCILNAGSDGHSQAFSLCVRNGPYNAPTPGTPGIYFETWDSDIFVPLTNMVDGGWHYLALTLSGNAVDIVIDGSQPRAYVWNGTAYGGLTGQPFALAYTPDTAPSGLGVGTTGLGAIVGGLVGTIADIAVYPRALPVAELARHYRLVTG